MMEAFSTKCVLYTVEEGFRLAKCNGTHFNRYGIPLYFMVGIPEVRCSHMNSLIYYSIMMDIDTAELFESYNFCKR